MNFTYDVAGNQIERKIVCINCNVVAMLNEVKPLEQNSLQIGRKLVAYPNPLTEILNVQWSSTDLSTIKVIDIYSVSGVRIYHQTFSSSFLAQVCNLC